MRIVRAAGPIMKVYKWILIFASAFGVIFVVSLITGPTNIPLSDIGSMFLGTMHDTDNRKKILFDIRLPRIILASLSGGALTSAGITYQVLLRNILADPYILGISAAASAGALIAESMRWAVPFVPFTAFILSAAVSVLVYMMAIRNGSLEQDSLLFSGVMIASILGAIVLGLLVLGGDPVRSALFWLFGSFSSAQWSSIPLLSIIVFGGFVVLLLQARAFNALAMGADTAAMLGVTTRKNFFIAYVTASLLTSAVVCVCGAIGFIGFVIPHITRKITGPDHRTLIPLGFLLGGIFLLGCDLLARTVFQPMELPIGIITAIVGAPAYLFIVLKRR